MEKRCSSDTSDGTSAPKIPKSVHLPSPGQAPQSIDVYSELIPELNDDCLLHIFSHLSTVDLCSVSDCSRRFKALALQAFRANNRGKQILIELAKSIQVSKNFAKMIHVFGEAMENVKLLSDLDRTISSSRERLFQLMSKKCTEIRELELSGRIPYYVLTADRASPRRFEHLKVLRVRNSINDRVFLSQILIMCPKLERLDIDRLVCCDHECIHVIEKYLKCIQEVVIRAVQFVADFKRRLSIPTLRKLQLVETEMQTPNTAKLLKSLTTANQLENLFIDCYTCDAYFGSVLGKLINLKSLTIRYTAIIENGFFENLSQRLKQLEHMELVHYDIRDDVEEHIVCVVGRFTALKTLNLTNFYWGVLNEAVFVKMGDMRRKSNATFPLNISFGYGHRIRSEILERYEPNIRLINDST